MLELDAILSRYRAFITYSPLRTEVPLLTLPAGVDVYQIPKRAALDPHEEARNAIARFGSSPVAMLIPGRRFDMAGTRHGQGGGWYDRFLADAPTEWLRIGVCFDDQFSPEALARQAWDQPMDVVCVQQRSGASLTCHLTGARGTLNG